MKFQVWLEGYRATCETGDATFCGEIEADTFEEACKKWAMTSSDPKYFNEKNNTFWCCRFFDNEAFR